MAEKTSHTKRSPKRYTVDELLSQLEENSDSDATSADIYITPPGDGQNSDEDDINDDIQESASTNDLSGRQLRSRAQARLTLRDGQKVVLGDDTDDDSDEEISDDSDDEPGPSARIQKSKKSTRTWRKEDLDPRPEQWNEPRPDFLNEDLTATKCFERFFDQTVIEHMVEETIRYARQKGDHTFSVTPIEMRASLGILFISGYNDLPRRRMYWEQQDDVLNLAVSKSMSRSRFETIMRYLHLADNNNLNATDKYAKVRPLFDLLNERFREFFPMEQHLSIDESMIPYYGKKKLTKTTHQRKTNKVWV